MRIFSVAVNFVHKTAAFYILYLQFYYQISVGLQGGPKIDTIFVRLNFTK